MNEKIYKIEEVNQSLLKQLAITHNLYVVAQDKRDKSWEQIKFLYVLLTELAKEFYGDSSKEILEELKNTLYNDFCKANNLDFFRTKTASVTDMKLFIDWLIRFMAKDFGITIALELVEESHKSAWVYAMTISRKCCVCGKHGADIHHVDKVGTGNNRNKVNHTKKKVISLCRAHHSEEESTGKLLKEYGLNGVYLSIYDLQDLGIRGDYFDEDNTSI